MKILVTGAAGFIGAALTEVLLRQGDDVVGLDNLNDYYDVSLKEARLKRFKTSSRFRFSKMDLADSEGVRGLFKKEKFEAVANLAAQAGVRYSLVNPYAYVESNLTGFVNILEGCRHNSVRHLVYASTSSVYGANRKLPFSEHHPVDHPISLYAATKRANELIAHSYSSMFNLPTTGVRFFTVYGPWGRPDMALFLFTKKILNNEPIEVFHEGKHHRDFTYVEDIVEAVSRIVHGEPPRPNPHWDALQPDPAASSAPFRIYNIGCSRTIELKRYIEVLEECLGKKAKIKYLPMQPGDVESTFADVTDLARDFDYQPKTTIEEGIKKFVAWYREFYRV